MMGGYLKNLLTAVVLSCIPCIGMMNSTSTPVVVDPRIFYNMMEIVCSEGYFIQEHNVVTEDGYILTIHRIPHSKRRPKVQPKITQYQNSHKGYHPDFENCVNESKFEKADGVPILLAHGLFAASDNWVLQGPKYDLAYLLLEEGYDVWFTNIRGNFYSRGHVNMTTSNPRFWDFSFHEIGKYDMTATIDFVLNATGYEKLFYVGHSMGTTMFFTMMATRPEYYDKVELFVGMAPVGQIKKEHFSESKAAVVKVFLLVLKNIDELGVVEFIPRTTLLGILGRTICAPGSALQNFCYDVGFAISGYSSKLYLRKKFPLIVAHGFAGASIKTLKHYIQTMQVPSFRYYDHGPEENIQRFGQAEPPEYDLKKINTPVAIYYSEGDYIVDYKDTELLAQNLPNVIVMEKLQKYSHTDFVWAYNAKEVVYTKIIELLKEFKIKRR